jgi:hypothetical protein
MAWDCFTTISGAEDVATIKCLEPLLTNAIKAIMALAGVALLVMMIVGGYSFLFAGGDQKKLEKAKGTITAAIIGIVIIVLAYLILKLIYAFTGVDVTQFNVVIK